MTTIIPPVKRCTKCGEEYPETPEYFHRNKSKLRPDCKQCVKAWQSAYRDNPERRAKAKQNTRDYYQNNTEHALNRIKACKKKNPEKYKSLARDWEKRNRDKVNERHRAYNKTHRDIYRMAYQRRQARKRAQVDDMTNAQWGRCLEYFNHQCAACGRRKGFWHTIAADHWVPLKAGGGTTISNIVPLCHATRDGDAGCNNSKSDRDAAVWLEETFGKRKGTEIFERVVAYLELAKGKR